MAIAYLMLGSNLGDKLSNLQMATKALEVELGTILRSSAIFESEPWGFIHPEHFYNQLLIVQTYYKAEVVMEKIIKIEEGMGRIRENKEYQARTIDIDIIFYNNQIIQTENLTVPHPKIAERRFVLLPFLKIDSTLVHPLTGLTIWEMYRDCRDNLEVKILEVKT
jgi:2-amino-4-hydroxy-6-hydroxymethyldihydropteridine diphosphokinase